MDGIGLPKTLKNDTRVAGEVLKDIMFIELHSTSQLVSFSVKIRSGARPC